MDQLIRASLSHTHYWYEVGMLKGPATNNENMLRHSRQVPKRPAGLSSDLHPPRSIEGKSRTKLCQKCPQVPGLGHLQSYARFKGGKTKQGYQRMVGWCRLMVMVMADGDGWGVMADGWWLAADGWWLGTEIGWWLTAYGWRLTADGWKPQLGIESES